MKMMKMTKRREVIYLNLNSSSKLQRLSIMFYRLLRSKNWSSMIILAQMKLRVSKLNCKELNQMQIGIQMQRVGRNRHLGKLIFNKMGKAPHISKQLQKTMQIKQLRLRNKIQQEENSLNMSTMRNTMRRLMQSSDFRFQCFQININAAQFIRINFQI